MRGVDPHQAVQHFQVAQRHHLTGRAAHGQAQPVAARHARMRQQTARVIGHLLQGVVPRRGICLPLASRVQVEHREVRAQGFSLWRPHAPQAASEWARRIHGPWPEILD